LILFKAILQRALDSLLLLKNQLFSFLSGFFVEGPSDLNKSMKNFADSNSGASVLSASKGIINKKSILESNPDSYLIIPGCR
jgi:hypothetical protein